MVTYACLSNTLLLTGQSTYMSDITLVKYWFWSQFLCLYATFSDLSCSPLSFYRSYPTRLPLSTKMQPPRFAFRSSGFYTMLTYYHQAMFRKAVSTIEGSAPHFATHRTLNDRKSTGWKRTHCSVISLPLTWSHYVWCCRLVIFFRQGWLLCSSRSLILFFVRA